MGEKKQQNIEDIAEGGVGAGFERYLIERGSDSPGSSFEALRAELTAKQEAMRSAKEQARQQIDTVPRPVTDASKERLRERTQNDIFGDRETQKHYIEGVREALETLDGDRLHDFIMDHLSYGKSSYAQWNAELSDLLGWQPEDRFRGRDKGQTDMRITAAVQHVFVDHYKNDVFQLTRKAINPWIFIDGKLGPYSVTVAGEYWASRFGATSTKQPNPPGLSGLDRRSYAEGSQSDQLYTEAVDYLQVQIAQSATQSAQETAEGDPADQLADKVQARYSRLDQAGETVRLEHLRLLPQTFDYEMPTNLSTALAQAFGENPKDATQSPRLFRTLNLIAQKVGAQIEDMKVQGGDTVEIDERGTLVVHAEDGTKRYEINLA